MKIAVWVLFILGGFILLGDDPTNELTNLEFLRVKLLGVTFVLLGVFLLPSKRIYVDYCKVKVNRRY